MHEGGLWMLTLVVERPSWVRWTILTNLLWAWLSFSPH
ncbi:hypothetical protein SAMCCGM7_pC0752 (plasmid) [Sinorhizobium americanum CCGM7]|nr:hypothetical protein SAMCCGM7_pC0752 [Sinorhizobium americanum CCGM7]